MALDRKYIEALRSLLGRRERPQLKQAPLRTAISEALGVGSGDSAEPVIEFPLTARFLAMPMNDATDTAGIPPGSDPALFQSKASAFQGEVGTGVAPTIANAANWWNADGSIVLHWATANADFATTLWEGSQVYSTDTKIYSSTYPGDYLADAPYPITGACVFTDSVSGTQRLIVACRYTATSTRFYSQPWQPTTQTGTADWTFVQTTTWTSFGAAGKPVRFSASGAKGVAVYSSIVNDTTEYQDWALSWSGSSVTVTNTRTYQGGLDPFQVNVDWNITSQETVDTYGQGLDAETLTFYYSTGCTRAGEVPGGDLTGLNTVLDGMHPEYQPSGDVRYQFIDTSVAGYPAGYPDLYEKQEYDDVAEEWQEIASLYIMYYTEAHNATLTFGERSMYYPEFGQYIQEYPNTTKSLAINADAANRLVFADFIGEDKVEVRIQAEVVSGSGSTNSHMTESNYYGVRTGDSQGVCSTETGYPPEYNDTCGGLTGSASLDCAIEYKLVRTGAVASEFPIYTFSRQASVTRSHITNSGIHCPGGISSGGTQSVDQTTLKIFRKLLHYDPRTDVIVWQEGHHRQRLTGSGTNTVTYSNEANYQAASGTPFTQEEAYIEQSVRMTTTGQIGNGDADVVVSDIELADSISSTQTEWGGTAGSAILDANDLVFDPTADNTSVLLSPMFSSKADMDNNCLVSGYVLFTPEVVTSQHVDLLVSGNGNAFIDPLPIVDALIPGGTTWTWNRTDHPNLVGVMLKDAGSDGVT